MVAKHKIDELARKLEAFHISDSIARIPAAHNGAPSIEDIKSLILSKHLEGHLPVPSPGQRPCWEPPVLNYIWFKDVIAAQKEFGTRHGNNDIE